MAIALGLTGCGAIGGDAATAAAGEAQGPALPPGVLPPNDPPQPGDAKLGPDGHYDYSAPDFVLKNPCDTDAYQVALQQGWKQPSFGTTRRDEPAEKTCSIVQNSTGMVLYSFAKTSGDFNAEEAEVAHEESRGKTLVVIKSPNLFGETCFAGIETPAGLTGALTGVGGFSNHSDIDSACEESKTVYHEIFGGIHAV
ncbi:hypothetical protein ACFWGD_09385 [Corynebacterium sp. NPDC060344]|uniref:hypothetical protein n=1 Tax=Corynebacterium sp. NPDC060344 TaxID=3347101 RepID=UPI00365E67AA